MAEQLHVDLIAEKNKIAGGDAWLNLFELQFDGGRKVVRLTEDESPTTFDSKTWEPYPLGLGPMELSSQGDLPTQKLTVGNVYREMQAFLEKYRGLEDERVVHYFVHSAHLGNPQAALKRILIVKNAVAGDIAVTFLLSIDPLFGVQWPYHRFFRRTCPKQFGAEWCGFGFPTLPSAVQDSQSCDHTYDGANGCVFHEGLYVAAAETGFSAERFGGMIIAPMRRNA